MPDEIPAKNQVAVGIDVGLNLLATLSTGEGIENHAFLKIALGKLCRAGHAAPLLHTRLEESGESAQTGGAAALSDDLPVCIV